MKHKKKAMAIVAAGTLFASGCSCVDEPFVRGVKGYADIQVEEYIAYVQADAGLTIDEKTDRVQASESFQRAADEAYDSVVGTGGDS